MQTIANVHCKTDQSDTWQMQSRWYWALRTGIPRFELSNVFLYCSLGRAIQWCKIILVDRITRVARTNERCVRRINKVVAHSRPRHTPLLHDQQATKKPAKHGQLPLLFSGQGLRQCSYGQGRINWVRHTFPLYHSVRNNLSTRTSKKSQNVSWESIGVISDVPIFKLLLSIYKRYP